MITIDQSKELDRDHEGCVDDIIQLLSIASSLTGRPVPEMAQDPNPKARHCQELQEVHSGLQGANVPRSPCDAGDQGGGKGFKGMQGLRQGFHGLLALAPLGRHILPLRHHLCEELLPAHM